MDPCVNCGIAINRCNTQVRRALDDEMVLSVIRQWRAPRPVSSNDHICQACWDLAQGSSLDKPRQLGHRSVCLRCGRSLATRTSYLLHTSTARELRIYNVIQEWITYCRSNKSHLSHLLGGCGQSCCTYGLKTFNFFRYGTKTVNFI